MKGVVILITIMFGMLGAALIAAAFAAGWALGARRRPQCGAPSPSETERERLLAEQRAFRTLLCYSPETAYGEPLTDEEV
jgi:hypothetical protein